MPEAELFSVLNADGNTFTDVEGRTIHKDQRVADDMFGVR